MRLISHRGNLAGPNSCVENHPDSIMKVLNYGYDCEIDVWKIDKYFLGHDEPQYEVEEDFLLQRGLWLHCKNLEALHYIKDYTNAFFHDKDDFTLTSNGAIWTYPGQSYGKKSVLVHNSRTEVDYDNLGGLCTDWVEWHEEQMRIIKL